MAPAGPHATAVRASQNRLHPGVIAPSVVGSFGMGARVVDWARLESVCAARHRGFESRPIRHAFGRSGAIAHARRPSHPGDSDLHRP